MPDRVGEGGGVAMVIPARYRIVQLAFDIARLRDLTLVSYRETKTPQEPLMHVWQPGMREWSATDISEYGSGAVFGRLPRKTILIGDDPSLLETLSQVTSWGGEMLRIATLDFVTLVNVLNGSLHFSPREWKWLAARYELELKDLNVEQRRYGRYGKPGKPLFPLRKTPPRPEPETPPAVEPAAEPVVEPAVEPVMTEPAAAPETAEGAVEDETSEIEAVENGTAVVVEPGKAQTEAAPEDK